MNTKTTLAGFGLLAVTVGGLGVGTAYASTNAPATAKISHSAPSAETSSATDSDNVQQGDQTGPDTAAPDILTAGDTPDSTNPAATADVATAGDKADSATSTEKAGTEAAGSETPDGSDGPGGYADPNSNADTQQEGEH